MPLIQMDVQPLSDEERAALRTRSVSAVCTAIGVPDRYVSIVIRESEPPNLVETGGWGPYESRELIPVTEAELRRADRVGS